MIILSRILIVMRCNCSGMANDIILGAIRAKQAHSSSPPYGQSDASFRTTSTL